MRWRTGSANPQIGFVCYNRTELFSDVKMKAVASQITCDSIVCFTVCWGADQRKNQSSTSLAIVRGIHRWPVVSPDKWPVMRKTFQFDDVIMCVIAINTRLCRRVHCSISLVLVTSYEPSDEWGYGAYLALVINCSFSPHKNIIIGYPMKYAHGFVLLRSDVGNSSVFNEVHLPAFSRVTLLTPLEQSYD